MRLSAVNRWISDYFVFVNISQNWRVCEYYFAQTILSEQNKKKLLLETIIPTICEYMYIVKKTQSGFIFTFTFKIL